MKNAMQLKAVIKNIAKDKHISAQLVMQNFMLERLLERISVSEYQQSFILKGGFLIAAMVGLDTRATMDMDATIKGGADGFVCWRLIDDRKIWHITLYLWHGGSSLVQSVVKPWDCRFFGIQYNTI